MEIRSRMARALTVAVTTFGALSLTGCSYWPSAGNNGLLYTNVTKPIAILKSDAAAVRKGEACSIGILGLFSSGDSSISAARGSVGISDITLVEERYRQYLLGLYSQYCVVVSGT